MAHPHEMRLIGGRVVAVYTDGDGDEYRVVSGERIYLSPPEGSEDCEDWQDRSDEDQ